MKKQSLGAPERNVSYTHAKICMYIYIYIYVYMHVSIYIWIDSVDR